MVRVAYSHLSQSIPEKTIKQTLKSYQLKYNLESLTLENALVEAKSIHQADKEFQKTHQSKQQNRLNHNQKIQNKRKELKQNIKELLEKEQSVLFIKHINKIKKQLSTLKNKKELPNYHLGHIVFGGKSNLLAHQKRVHKLNQQIQFTQNNIELTKEEKENKIKELTNLIQKSKQQWKDSRLRPLSICGETRKGGNRFFKISDDLKTCYLTFSRSSTGGKAGKTITDTAELSLAQLNGKWNHILKELVKLASEDEITLFFRLNHNKLDITYDETILTKSFQIKMLQTKVKQTDSLKVKKLKTMNPLKRENIIDFKHPESSIMTKVENNRAIGIDLNPEWIGVSVIEFINNKDLSLHDVNQVQVLDYKLFKIHVKVNNKDNEYNKKAMCECLSGIADEVFKLVRFYNIGKIYLEDGLGNLKGGTKSKHLNGLLNYWGRSIFTRILERKARLTECESLTVKYHVADEETGELKYRKIKVGDKFEERQVYKTVVEYRQGIQELENPVIGSVVEKEKGLKSCVSVEYVWAGYSSIIGNMIDWQVLSKESQSDSLDNTCNTQSGLIPDACSASIEIARRGLIKSFTCKVELPLFDLRNLIVTKKDLLGLEQLDFCENGWRKLSVMLRQVPKETWRKSGFIGYRNQHHSYFVKGKGVVTGKITEVCFKDGLTDVGKNDSHVRYDIAKKQNSSTLAVRSTSERNPICRIAESNISISY
jgi:uncharacterized protein YkvS